jgi:hypothetical protein
MIDKFLRNLAWICVVMGLLLITISNYKWFNSTFDTELNKIGYTVLTSGVFAGILKSFQFIGIFKTEIENVILQSSFVKKRNDLPELWKAISAQIYKQKFPEISQDLQEMILSNYFPTDHDFYYDQAYVSINVTGLSDDGILSYTQTQKFMVKLAEGVTDVTMKHMYSIDKGENITLANNELEYYKIDNVDVKADIKTHDEETEFKISRTCSYEVSNKKEFVLEIKEFRHQSLKSDNYKLFRTSKITREMNVNISYPDNIVVSFFNVGVVDRFERIHVGSPNSITRIHKKGLILPHQGFGMTFESK